MTSTLVANDNEGSTDWDKVITKRKRCVGLSACKSAFAKEGSFFSRSVNQCTIKEQTIAMAIDWNLDDFFLFVPDGIAPIIEILARADVEKGSLVPDQRTVKQARPKAERDPSSMSQEPWTPRWKCSAKLVKKDAGRSKTSTFENQIEALKILTNKSILHTPQAFIAVTDYVNDTWRLKSRWKWAEINHEETPKNLAPLK
ncbi:hypothetical protein CROQUDRAFT_110250 [Cronartium quercuum f. sp. fusiforme G11]|uniref:Uncharacterized protein n=1 Tax=Cronartium quercuum f. sp. fusiforme G11 TaxID=708437 RepID=A0A9P6N903_9BASI|nr:hypothetical protein CROQUDRAFT_110250 [Cronartium quercuum f. sp. fusiforme G11]